MVLELQLDPWRGGFELLEHGRTLLLVAGASRGGPKLAEAHQIVKGDHAFMSGRLRCGPIELSYDATTRLLAMVTPETVVRVRLDLEPEVLRVVFQDFK